METKNRYSQRLSKRRILVRAIAIAILILPFQNCNSVGETPATTDAGTSGSTTTGANQPGPTCSMANLAPNVLGIYSDARMRDSDRITTPIEFRVGQGTDAGTSLERRIYIKTNDGGDGISSIDRGPEYGRSYFAVSAMDMANVRLGQTNDNAKECTPGEDNIAYEIFIRASDSLTDALCPLRKTLQSSATDPNARLRVTVRNNCLATQKIGSPLGSGSYLGERVAIDGNWAVAAGSGYNHSATKRATGGAIVYKLTAGVWSQFGSPLVPSNVTNNAKIHTVAIKGNYIALGAPDSERPGLPYAYNPQGMVWIYKYNSGTAEWQEVDYLRTAVNESIVSKTDRLAMQFQLQEGGQFGSSLAFAGDKLIVGSKWADALDSGGFIDIEDRGEVFVYGGTDYKDFKQRIFSPCVLAEKEKFGTSVAVSGNFLAVGAPGVCKDPSVANPAVVRGESVYIYEFNSVENKYEIKQRINNFASDGIAEKEFGFSLAMDGANLLVGARSYRAKDVSGMGTGPSRIGKSYLFIRNVSGEYEPQSSLQLMMRGGMSTATPAVDSSRLGESVAITSNRIIAGAPAWNNATPTITPGAILIFDHAGVQMRRVTVPGSDRTGATAFFGQSVAASGNWAIVGAPGVNGNGGVYFLNLTEPLP